MKHWLFIGALMVSISNYAQKTKVHLNSYNFQEIEQLQKKAPKPVVIFLYTDWCKICFGMKKNTFQNPEVIQKLNEDYYLILFNGEEKENITFLGKTFSYQPSGNSGMHELAKQLTISEKRTSYPTTIILNNNYEIDLLMDGYLNAKKLTSILNKYLKH